MAEWQDAKLNPFQEHTKLQLHMEQLPETTWGPSGEIFHNYRHEKDAMRDGQEGADPA